MALLIEKRNSPLIKVKKKYRRQVKICVVVGNGKPGGAVVSSLALSQHRSRVRSWGWAKLTQMSTKFAWELNTRGPASC